jgi:ParB-like chromosome segregation protein Spo0J
MAKAKAKPAPLAIKQVPIDSIHLDPANVRKHGERNQAALKASLARFGQQKPIVIDGDGIVRAGNSTLEAARALGWTTIAAVRTTLTGSEATAYAIADNRTAELAEWDETGLAEQLRSLQSEDIDLSDVGYTDDELDRMLNGLANDILPADVNGKEYDESIADEVEFFECPQCNHRWPK